MIPRHSLLVALLLASACATWPAELGPRVVRVAGTDLPVLTSEPDVDMVFFFVVPADVPLAERYRKQALSTARLDPLLGGKAGDAPPPGLPPHLVGVERAPEGRLFLYEPCDGTPAHVVVRGGRLAYTLGIEPLGGRILGYRVGDTATEVVIEPFPDHPYRLVLRPYSVPGVFELSEPDLAWSSTYLVATPEAAAKLDLVINRCRGGKRVEFPFRADLAELTE
jgi:hypothetical protein